jgi:predicted HAD superfamily phosphohydrolase YqeG
MPIVSLKGHAISPELQKVIGEKYAFRHRIVVMSNEPDHVKVALAEPHLEIFGYLEKAMPKGKHIVFYLARESEIENCFH